MYRTVGNVVRQGVGPVEVVGTVDRTVLVKAHRGVAVELCLLKKSDVLKKDRRLSADEDSRCCTATLAACVHYRSYPLVALEVFLLLFHREQITEDEHNVGKRVGRTDKPIPPVERRTSRQPVPAISASPYILR